MKRKDNHPYVADAIPYLVAVTDVSVLRKDKFRHFSEIKIPSIEIKTYDIKTS